MKKLNLLFLVLVTLLSKLGYSQSPIDAQIIEINSVGCDASEPVLFLAAYSNPPAPHPLAHHYYKMPTVEPRTLTGIVAFANAGWKYDLDIIESFPQNYCATDANGNWSQFQNSWNKLMAIKVDKFDGTENSVRVGFKFRNTGEHAGKMELGFYGHINHLQWPNIPDHILDIDFEYTGREFVSTGVFVEPDEVTPQPFYFELKLYYRDFYVRAENVGILVHRHFYPQTVTPESDFLTSRIDIEAYYGDYSKNKWHTTNDLRFPAVQLTVDNPINSNLETSVPVLKLMNSIFYDGEVRTYRTRDSLIAPIKSESGLLSMRHKPLPYAFENDFKFTVIESGADVEFKSVNQITLKAGFTAKEGSHFKASLIPYCNDCKKTTKEFDTPKASQATINQMVNMINEKNIAVDSSIISPNDQIKLSEQNKSTINYPADVLQLACNPNPANNFIKITTNILTQGNITINSSLGNELFYSTYDGYSKNIDISFLNSGLYFINFREIDGTAHTIKFIKQ